MKVVTVLGARPQFVKAGPLSRALARRGHCEVLVHTGQHYDDAMSKAFFDDLGLPAVAVNLEVGSGSHGSQTAAIMVGLERELLQHKPDWVVVYGDTNSTVAGGLVAAKLHLPLAHVEAGLRSFNRRMPEEVNRVVVDSIADVLLAPTPLAADNLTTEGIHVDDVYLTGDVMFDAALIYGARPDAEQVALWSRLGIAPKQYVLATIHRADNTETVERLAVILDGFKRVAEQLPVVLPLHPRTQAMVDRSPELRALAEPLMLVPPVGYFDMVTLERHAAVIATDSGGVQKEALFHRTPCVTLRSETEWVETVTSGWNTLCLPSSAEAIASAVLGAIGREGKEVTLYGDGNAADRIVEVLEQRMARPFRRADGRASA